MSSSHPSIVIDLVFLDTSPAQPISVQESNDIQQEDVHDADNDDGNDELPKIAKIDLQEPLVEPTAELRKYPLKQRKFLKISSH